MSETIPIGICQCGCGKTTLIITKTDVAKGRKKGNPQRFIMGHQTRGSNNSKWKGGRKIRKSGYIYLLLPYHPQADPQGYVAEHLIIAERALGKSLPAGAEIHHLDGNKSNNQNNNLIICQNRKYHGLLHI